MKLLKSSQIAAMLLVASSAHATIQQVSTDTFHTLYIDNETKEVMTMGGSKYFRETGVYTTLGQNTPIVYGVGNAKSVVSTSYRSYVLKLDGTVWASGREFGQEPIPLPVIGVSDVAATDTVVLVLQDGVVSEYSIQNGGELVVVPDLPTNVVEVIAGHFHCAVLTSDGLVYIWGHNQTGQLGDGTTLSNINATMVSGVPQIRAVSISNENTVLTDVDGGVWAFGDGRSGINGNGTDETELTPYNIGIPNPENVKKAYAGNTHTTILMNDGTVQVVGWHNFIGNDAFGKSLYNVSYDIVEIGELVGIVELDATGNHHMFRQADGEMMAWGGGGQGQLGNGRNIETHYPEYVLPGIIPDGYLIEYQEEIVSECPIVEPTTITVVEYVEVIKHVEVIKYVDVIEYVEVIKYVDNSNSDDDSDDDDNEYDDSDDSDDDKEHDDNGHGNDDDRFDDSNPGKKYEKHGKSKK